ncbi:MAG TPA: DUF1501 domain-containing protein [Planktothrix sp.]|jgi:uncharacterized protein (DUF1501 family)
MDVSRRTFLKSGISMAGVCLGWSHLSAIAAYAASFEPRKPGSSKILVVVQLLGGNDGINTVIPYSSPAYYKLRPTIAIKQEQVLHLNNDIGLHPEMKGMADLFKSGKLAVVAGAGYPNPNRSHFRSIEIWQTAQPDKIADTGWLGRYLDQTSEGKTTNSKVFPAINVDPSLPKSLSANRVLVPSVTDVNQFRFNTDAHAQQDRQCQLDSFKRIYSNYDLGRPDVKLLSEVGLDAMQASDYLLGVVKQYKDGVVYPNSGFARSLKFISQMICAGVDSRIYNVSLGGFDTHAAQQRTQASLLQQLSEGITAFQKDLEDHHLDQDVMIVTISEFGRRVAQNNGNGTDHGTAEPVFIVGSGVKGGVYGEYPSLNNLDSGDLKFTTDFRSIYATLLDRWLKGDSKQILGGRFDHLAFV